MPSKADSIIEEAAVASPSESFSSAIPGMGLDPNEWALRKASSAASRSPRLRRIIPNSLNAAAMYGPKSPNSSAARLASASASDQAPRSRIISERRIRQIPGNPLAFPCSSHQRMA